MIATTELRPVGTVPSPSVPWEPPQLLEPPVPVSDRWPYPVRSPRGS